MSSLRQNKFLGENRLFDKVNKISLDTRPSSIRPTRLTGGVTVAGTRRTASVPCSSQRFVRPVDAHLSVNSLQKDDPFSVLQSYTATPCADPMSRNRSSYNRKTANYLKRDEHYGHHPVPSGSLSSSSVVSAQLIQRLSAGMAGLQDQLTKMTRQQEVFAKETVAHLRLIADSVSSVIDMQSKSLNRFTEDLLIVTQKLDRLEAIVSNLEEAGLRKESTRSLSPKLSPHYPRFVGS